MLQHKSRQHKHVTHDKDFVMKQRYTRRHHKVLTTCALALTLALVLAVPLLPVKQVTTLAHDMYDNIVYYMMIFLLLILPLAHDVYQCSKKNVTNTKHDIRTQDTHDIRTHNTEGGIENVTPNL